MKRLGLWILLYDVLCVGALGVAVNFGFALSEGASGKLYSLTPAQNIFFTIAYFMMCTGWLCGFILLLIGGTGLLSSKRWAGRVSDLGIGFVFLMCAGIVLSALFIFDPAARGDLIFFLVTAFVPVTWGVYIFKSLHSFPG